MNQERAGIAAAERAFESGVHELRLKVETALEARFDARKPDGGLVCAIRHSLLSPGKRVRPLIALLACRQSGGRDENALAPACAAEMVHAASLIMDDLPSMDNARMRRGALATHVVFGESATMLASVALINEATSVILESASMTADAKLRAMAHLTRAIGVDGLVGGQQRDIVGASAAVTMSDVQQCHVEKTGVLFAAAAAMGGEAANAPADVVKSLWAFGCNLGLAYQAFDDVLDSVCTEEQAGKDVDQDVNKSTVVSFLGAEGARANADRWLGRAIVAAETAAEAAGGAGAASPLADLARAVGARFRQTTG